MRKRYIRQMMLAAAISAAVLTGCQTAANNAAPAESEALVEIETEAGDTDNKEAESEAKESEVSLENADASADPADDEAEKAAEESPEGMPEDAADSEAGAGRKDNEPPAKPDAEAPEGMPPGEGGPGGPGGAPGGPGGSKPESYDAVNIFDEDAEIADDSTLSAGTDENAVLVTAGDVRLTNVTIERTSSNSTGGDSSSFYGVGAAVLATGGTLTIEDAVITTDAAGGAGAFAYGDGVIYIRNSTITTAQGTSGGVHAAGGGTLYAANVTAVTDGASSAAVRSDRGGGKMVIESGSYTSNGSGSPAVYCTADITIDNAELTATGSEAVCIEGLNSLKLTDCVLTGDMPDDGKQNDNTWTVIVYQSMSGDSEIGCGSFAMSGGRLVSKNGGLFYTTNTESEIILENVEIEAADDCEFFLQATGNTNARGWGKAGANGADCTFTGIRQSMQGDVIWDSISTLRFVLQDGSIFTGAVLQDESYTGGTAGDGTAAVEIDESSKWIVTGDSYVTVLTNHGTIEDAEGKTVSVVGTDGTVYVEGESTYKVTVTAYHS